MSYARIGQRQKKVKPETLSLQMTHRVVKVSGLIIQFSKLYKLVRLAAGGY